MVNTYECMPNVLHSERGSAISDCIVDALFVVGPMTTIFLDEICIISGHHTFYI